jgi:hypothetical protein
LRRPENFQDLPGGKILCRRGKRPACTPATGLSETTAGLLIKGNKVKYIIISAIKNVKFMKIKV